MIYRSFPRILSAALLSAGLAMDPGSAAAKEIEEVRTTAYTHTEADHLEHGRKTASGTILRNDKSYTSAAADWSKYPLGTKFKIKGMDTTFVVDDYGRALVGTETIDLYHPSKSSMNRWGVRHVDIQVVEMGDYQRSREILAQRTQFAHVRKMLSSIDQREKSGGKGWALFKPSKKDEGEDEDKPAPVGPRLAPAPSPGPTPSAGSASKGLLAEARPAPAKPSSSSSSSSSLPPRPGDVPAGSAPASPAPKPAPKPTPPPSPALAAAAPPRPSIPLPASGSPAIRPVGMAAKAPAPSPAVRPAPTAPSATPTPTPATQPRKVRPLDLAAASVETSATAVPTPPATPAPGPAAAPTGVEPRKRSFRPL